MGIMEASFNAEEQQLIDRLRNKYARDVSQGAGWWACRGLNVDSTPAPLPCPRQETCTGCDLGAALDQPAPPTAESTGRGAQTRSGSNVDAQVCAHCQGTGTIVEIYNHRRLEVRLLED